MPLISSKIYYFVGVLLIVVGIWSTLFGSLQALIIVVVGVGIIIYGREISRKEKVLNLIMSSGHWNEGGADNKNINEQREKEQQNIDATYMSIVYALMEGDIEKANNHLNDGFDINQLSSESDQCLLPLILGQGKGELLVKLARIVSKKETCSEDERQQSKNLVELHDKIDRGALFLIAHGADIFAKDVNDRTPLMVAAKNGLINSLISLIDAGSDLNYQRDDGRTALMDAVSERGVESVRILLDSGATKNLQDKNGKIALDFVHELDDKIRSLLSS